MGMKARNEKHIVKEKWKIMKQKEVDTKVRANLGKPST
jgi:hypothetical protein